MKYITIIPARGGSKRFLGKNIHQFMGKPLIAHSIEYSKSCSVISHTYVSTDDDQIKKVSMHYGTEVIDRPKVLGGDLTTSAAVMQNAVQNLIRGEEFDYVLLLQATNPLRPKILLNHAIQLIEENKAESLMTVYRSELKLGKIVDNYFVPWNYHFGQRSQD